jgi:hypothetical protein
MPAHSSVTPERQHGRARCCYKSGNVILVLSLLALVTGLLGPQVVQYLLDRGVSSSFCITVWLAESSGWLLLANTCLGLGLHCLYVPSDQSICHLAFRLAA